MEKKVSIIVPVFNVKEYLNQCVNSILNQTHTFFELILIDDGSFDGSGQICDSYEKLDARVKVIHQNNSGVSKARNIGLKLSTGDFVCFVDSDDYVENDYVEKLLKSFENEDCDLSVDSYKMKLLNSFVDIHGKQKQSVYDITKKNVLFKLYQNILTPSPCSKMFKKNKITNYFDEEISYMEDDIFVLNYLKNTKKIYFQDNLTYIYRNDFRETLTRKAYKDFFGQLKKVQPKREKALLEINNDKKLLKALAMSNIRQTTDDLQTRLKNGDGTYNCFKENFNQVTGQEFYKSQLKICKPRNFKEFVVKMLIKFKLKKIYYKIIKKLMER